MDTSSFEDVFPFHYVGGGYFRKKDVPIGEVAETLHGIDAARFVFNSMHPGAIKELNDRLIARREAYEAYIQKLIASLKEEIKALKQSPNIAPRPDVQMDELKVQPDGIHDALLQGQPKPTGEQLEWVFAYLADLCQSDGQSYGYVLQRMYGFPSREKMIAQGAGQLVTNTINCAIENPEVMKNVGQCYI